MSQNSSSGLNLNGNSEINGQLPSEQYEEFKKFHERAPYILDHFLEFLTHEVRDVLPLSNTWNRFCEFLGNARPVALSKNGGKGKHPNWQKYYAALAEMIKERTMFVPFKLDVSRELLISECRHEEHAEQELVQLADAWDTIHVFLMDHCELYSRRGIRSVIEDVNGVRVGVVVRDLEIETVAINSELDRVIMEILVASECLSGTRS